MAYTRRRPVLKYKKRSYKVQKKPWYNRSYTPGDLAFRAFKGVMALRGLVNSERHYKDSGPSLGLAKSRITPLHSIAQGDATSDRNGNSILVRSLYMRGFLQVNPAVALNTRVSLALVQDTQQIGDTTPAISDIFNSDDPEAMLNTSNTNYTAGRFKIIWRKNFNLTNVSASRPTIQLEKYFKLYSHIKYNGPTATDIQKNGYYLVMLTSETTNFPIISFTTRLGYHDN